MANGLLISNILLGTSVLLVSMFLLLGTKGVCHDDDGCWVGNNNGFHDDYGD